MSKKVFISLAFFLAFFLSNSLAQSAQATMRVSVRVVSGSSVEMMQSGVAIFDKENVSSLGLLRLKGIDKSNILIRSSKEVTLKSREGHEIKMAVIAKRHSDKENNEQIKFEGATKGEMLSNVYQGRLETTIEYF